MQARRIFSAVDSHTEGMPTRVITSGPGVLPGTTMFDRMRYLVSERDDLRTLLMYEPRGHAAMSGAILQPPARPDADVGVVFIEVSGCLPMCGHGTIGTATVLVETGMVAVREPVTLIRLDTPAGLVEASVAVSDGRATSVTIRNVPSYLHLRDAAVTVPGAGELTLDVAFGGNFCAILPAGAAGLAVRPELHDRIVATGLAIMDTVNEQLTFAHPENPEISECRHVVFTEPAEGDRPALRRGRHSPGLGGPLPLRYRHVGADGAARGARGTGHRRGLRARVTDRDDVHRAPGRTGHGGRLPGGRAHHPGPCLADRHRPLPAGSGGPVSSRVPDRAAALSPGYPR